MSGPCQRPLPSVPDLSALSDRYPDLFPFLLESAAVGPLGRRSLLLFADNEELRLDPDGSLSGPGAVPGAEFGFFDRLRSWYLDLQVVDGPAGEGKETEFTGGWFLYLGYEAAGEIEPTLKLPSSGGLGSGWPVAFARRCPAAIVIDHAPSGDEARLVAEDAETLSRVEALVRARSHSAAGQHDPAAGQPGSAHLLAIEADPPSRFIDAVERIHDYLAAGDVFQVNISRGWRGRFDRAPGPTPVLASMRTHNPAPFSGMIRRGAQAVLSSSPERLVRVRNQRVDTRPIAGTRPRGDDPAGDRDLHRELIGNAKERAEHIMLIDLERNDLGRVCVPGSIEVDELMVVESYAHVHHIVSNVSGELRPDCTPVDAIRAVFPGGTITGCPKVRCMEIIAELERSPRGFYTGAMGYLGRDGQLDLNILIRSLMLDGEEFSFRCGAGIVADSDPERELMETEDKAKGLIDSLTALGAPVPAAAGGERH